MPGKMGMKRGVVTTSLRQRMWNSMRIMKRFSKPDILRTVSGATYSNALKFFGRLEKAGIIGKIGSYVSGRPGEYQGYVLLKDVGPVMPVLNYGKGSNVPPTTNNGGDINNDL